MTGDPLIAQMARVSALAVQREFERDLAGESSGWDAQGRVAVAAALRVLADDGHTWGPEGLRALADELAGDPRPGDDWAIPYQTPEDHARDAHRLLRQAGKGAAPEQAQAGLLAATHALLGIHGLLEQGNQQRAGLVTETLNVLSEAKAAEHDPAVVERVARAICAASGDNWHDARATGQAHYLAAARAAINELRRGPANDQEAHRG